MFATTTNDAQSEITGQRAQPMDRIGCQYFLDPFRADDTSLTPRIKIVIVEVGFGIRNDLKRRTLGDVHTVLKVQHLSPPLRARLPRLRG